MFVQALACAGISVAPAYICIQYICMQFWHCCCWSMPVCPLAVSLGCTLNNKHPFHAALQELVREEAKVAVAAQAEAKAKEVVEVVGAVAAAKQVQGRKLATTRGVVM